jgi:hypothetical protein
MNTPVDMTTVTKIITQLSHWLNCTGQHAPASYRRNQTEILYSDSSGSQSNGVQMPPFSPQGWKLSNTGADCNGRSMHYAAWRGESTMTNVIA